MDCEKDLCLLQETTKLTKNNCNPSVKLSAPVSYAQDFLKQVQALCTDFSTIPKAGPLSLIEFYLIDKTVPGKVGECKSFLGPKAGRGSFHIVGV